MNFSALGEQALENPARIKRNRQLVSIMMPAYNAEDYIDQAITSVLDQTYREWELILIDDGSTDRTGQIITQYNDPRIQIYFQDNAGEAAARNTALGHMKGDFVAFLDADDLFLPDHIEVAVGYLTEHPEYDGVYSDGYYCDQDGTTLKSLSSRRRGPFEGWIFEETVRSSDVFGPPVCVFLRREIITRHDLAFDPEIVIGPDWDFLTRYSEVARFGYINRHTCLYRIHTDNISLRTNQKKRALSLAHCREKAIRLNSFNRCSPKTREAVFYDLLVNLLAGSPERQSNVTLWPEFGMLPEAEQARIFRLMASTTIASGEVNPYVAEWLQKSRKLNPDDRRGTILSSLYRFSPNILQKLLGSRNMIQNRKTSQDPFSDLRS